jgi:hypothetical protein
VLSSDGSGLTYEYMYTVDGWYTSAALAAGKIETADGEGCSLTMRLSLQNRLRTNFYVVTLFLVGRPPKRFLVKDVLRARRTFALLCEQHKMNHKRFNPQ